MRPRNGHISGPRGSPDMICYAFHVKFHDETNGIPPRACRPSTKSTKNNEQDMDPTNQTTAMFSIWVSNKSKNKNYVQDMAPTTNNKTMFRE